MNQFDTFEIIAARRNRMGFMVHRQVWNLCLPLPEKSRRRRLPGNLNQPPCPITARSTARCFRLNQCRLLDGQHGNHDQWGTGIGRSMARTGHAARDIRRGPRCAAGTLGLSEVHVSFLHDGRPLGSFRPPCAKPRCMRPMLQGDSRETIRRPW